MKSSLKYEITNAKKVFFLIGIMYLFRAYQGGETKE